jgi:DDE superfamily endonuclease
LLTQASGDIDEYVWRFLREHNIDLAARKSWCESNDPEFVAKAADVVGLYADPPASIEALGRAQGHLNLRNGRALTGQNHDHKRHGTTTLFAALEVATGKIIASHSKRRRRVEFLGFMNSVVAAFPDNELHVILDNLNTHKKNKRWLKKYPNVRFISLRHGCPCSIRSKLGFRSGSARHSTEQLQEHIDAFITAYNETAEPFAWS